MKLRKKGPVLAPGTHPTSESAEGTVSSIADREDVTYVINSFRFGAVRAIVQKNTISFFPIAYPAPKAPFHDQDEITRPRYAPTYNKSKGESQNPTFNRNVNSQTYWGL